MSDDENPHEHDDLWEVDELAWAYSRYQMAASMLNERIAADAKRGQGLRVHVKARLDVIGPIVAVHLANGLDDEAIVTAILGAQPVHYIDRQAVRRDLKRLASSSNS